jgi:hypothetical protein
MGAARRMPASSRNDLAYWARICRGGARPPGGIARPNPGVVSLVDMTDIVMNLGYMSNVE